MKRFKRYGLIALLLLLGMQILTIAPSKIGSNKPDPAVVLEEVPKPKAPKELLSQTMQGVRSVGTSPKGREWELFAQSAQGYREKGQWELANVNVKFFGKEGTYYTVTGNRGTIDGETKDMDIEGDVVMRTSSGYVLKTDSMAYGAVKKTLQTEERVVMTGPKKNDEVLKMEGKGIRVDIDSNVMSLKSDVKTTKSVPPSRTMTIKSDWATINGKSNEAHFEENVRVDIDRVRMTGDMADFIYNSRKKALESLDMKGDVKVTSGDRWASSQRAKVLFQKDEFILTGSPRVIQDENEMRGREIRFLKGGKEVRVVKAKAKVDNETAAGGRR